MRIRHPQWALAAASGILVTFLVVVDLSRTSPGPLSMAHLNVEGLTESSCERCHGDGTVTMAEACADCHGPLALQIARGSGFHGELENGRDCGHCHVEHLGAELPLVGERTFALAGFDPRELYQHEGLQFVLTGKHDELDCGDCHANANVRVLQGGERRFLGASQECAVCHEDPHDGRMLEGCQSCHGQAKPFADLDGFAHSSAFPLAGVHAQAKCDACHESGSAYAVERLGGLLAPEDRACGDCHESPHTGVFLARVASTMETGAGASCVACHGLEVSEQGFADYDVASATRLHFASGFELAPPHDQASCADCHGQTVRAPRVADDCVACHAGPHGTQFERGPFAGFDCRACHAREHFVPSTFDVGSHAPTGFPLVDGHETTECASCHLPLPDQSLGRTDFTAVAKACSDCHLDAHGGRLLAQEIDLPAPEACDTCHRPTSFSDGASAEFEHGLWTVFTLDGVHRDAACEACHQRSKTPDALGRRFGRVHKLFGSPTGACATCHENVHVGQLAGTTQGCDECHNTTAFEKVDVTRFNHAQATGFGLVGAHARADCNVCHAPRARADDQGRLFGLVAETHGKKHTSCVDCHEDPHRGRFRKLRSTLFPKGRIGCVRCHDQETFKGAARERFEHGLWTDFPLEDVHGEIECNACHLVPTAQTLGRTLGRACSDCHGDSHHGQFGKGDAGRCDRCHQSSADFSILAFNHATDSRFVLDEDHGKLECAKCHKPWPMRNGEKTVRYKPLGLECADCHLGGVPK